MPAVIAEEFWEMVGDRWYGPHDVDEITDYPFDWTGWLAASGNDTIVSAQAIYEAPLAQPVGKPPAFDAQHVTLWATAGTEGQSLRLTCRITTAGGRVQDRSVFLRCGER